MRTNWVIFITTAVMLFFFSCSGFREKSGIEFDLTVKPDELCDHSYVKMIYSFGFNRNYQKMKKNYMVYVHFWRIKSKEMLLQDDHYPVEKSFKWRPGTEFTYDRTLFIPKLIDEIYEIDFNEYESIRISVGLFRPGNTKDMVELYKKEFKLKPASEVLPDIVYAEGWNVKETNPEVSDKKYRSWRWTRREAKCIIENTRQESTLIIRGGVDKEKFADQNVALLINNKPLDQFVPATGKFEKQYTLSKEMLGDTEEILLTIKTNRSFIPAAMDASSTDIRELGIQVFFLYFNESL
jgi:hypothetical protein